MPSERIKYLLSLHVNGTRVQYVTYTPPGELRAHIEDWQAADPWCRFDCIVPQNQNIPVKVQFLRANIEGFDVAEFVERKVVPGQGIIQ